MEEDGDDDVVRDLADRVSGVELRRVTKSVTFNRPIFIDVSDFSPAFARGCSHLRATSRSFAFR